MKLLILLYETCKISCKLAVFFFFQRVSPRDKNQTRQRNPRKNAVPIFK